MLYGYRKDKTTTVVTAVANNNYAAYEAWFRSLQDDTDLVINVYETNFMDHFSEEYSRNRPYSSSVIPLMTVL
jgi:hypothetical protein